MSGLLGWGGIFIHGVYFSKVNCQNLPFYLKLHFSNYKLQVNIGNGFDG